MNPPRHGRHHQHPSVSLILAPVGAALLLRALGESIDPVQAEQLAAYGLVPGCRLTVLQHKPMTVLAVDELELALEHGVARDIWVEEKASPA